MEIFSLAFGWLAQVGVNGYPEWLDHLPAGWPGWMIALVTLGWSRFGAPAKALVEALVAHTEAMKSGMDKITGVLEHVAETQRSLAMTSSSIAETQNKLADVATSMHRLVRDLDDTAQRLESQMAELRSDLPLPRKRAAV